MTDSTPATAPLTNPSDPPALAAHPDLLAAAVKLAVSAVGQLTRCELTSDDGCERCPGTPTAIRYEHGFTDAVCDKHADRAESRGALVLRQEVVNAT